MVTLLAFLFKISFVLGLIVTAFVVASTILSLIINAIGDFITGSFLFVENFFGGKK